MKDGEICDSCVKADCCVRWMFGCPPSCIDWIPIGVLILHGEEEL